MYIGDQIVISAQNVSLAYVEDEPIIYDATFQVRKGEFVFITGPSGSGKSTLLKSLYGEIKPRSGELIVTNTRINNIKESALMTLRQHIGIVFQDYKLIKEWNIEKNVMLPLLIAGYSKRVCEAQVDKLLAHVDLYHRKGRFPVELSGGEQQRVAMARALAHNPTIILADEPTGNLDAYSSGVIWKLLEGANQQLETTIVVVTHNIPPALNIEYSHYSIHDGRIVNEKDRYGVL
ncbi:MAG TPA: ABC transporter ATP-binding protein [Campylobacterales bacterium]|nr:ABC transporter ATP-binding protein [Campylobacterales bacterium]